MAVEIGALRALLSLDSAAFEKGVKRARGSTQRLADTMRKVSKVAATAFAAVAASAISGARDIDKAAKAARRLDASIGGFEALKLAADEAGVPLSALPNELQNINREIANIGTSGNADRALKLLGISAAELAGLDADEKIARIADQVQKLGLSSGKATSLLRDLGVRNREMVLLLQGGGDAIRQARQDVIDYGLALSGPTVAAIEQANDRIGRLSLVTRVFGQQMAVAVVPALGALALAITDSLREGGALRAGIDAIVSVTRGWVEIISAAAAGISNLADLIGGPTILAVSALSAALVILRRRMILTGIGAMIVAAGALVDFLTRLKEGTGSWGEALSALGDLAAGVWEGIKTSAQSITPALGAVWKDIQAGFFSMLSNLTEVWSRFLGGLGADLSGVIGFGDVSDRLLQASGDAVAELSRFDARAQSAASAAAGLRSEASALASKGFDKAKEAAARLMEIVNGEADATRDATTEAEKLKQALEEMGDGSGGAGKAGKGVDDLADSVDRLADKSKQAADRFGDFAASVITRARSIGDVVSQLGSQLISKGISGLFKSSGLGDIFSGFLDGGGMVPAGNFAIAGERGPEIVTGPARVTSRADTARMLQGGGGGGRVEVVARVENGSIVQDVRRISGDVAVQVVSDGIAAYDRNTLPGSFDRISKDPKRRG